jgi:two-component system, NarL family, sensor kinase
VAVRFWGSRVFGVGHSLFSLTSRPILADQPDLSGLVAVHGRMMRNYFRLVRVEERLCRRSRSSPVISAAEARESERVRLARELHAGAGQALAGIRIHLELIDSLIGDPPPPVRASLQRIGLLAQEALDQMRSLTHRTYPPAWERMRLAEAIERLWNLTGIPQRYQAQLEVGDLEEEPPREIRILLYRAAQEALANVVRHAGATRVALRLWQSKGRIGLAVQDDGGGFDVTRLTSLKSPAPEGIGVRSIREQAAARGGEFHVESGAGGTTVSIILPMPEG